MTYVRRMTTRDEDIALALTQLISAAWTWRNENDILTLYLKCMHVVETGQHAAAPTPDVPVQRSGTLLDDGR